MTIRNAIKFILAAWVIPIAIVAVVIRSTPGSNHKITDFPSVNFTPANIATVRKVGSKGSDYFELHIRDVNGQEFFVRDPEQGPIEELRSRIPDGIALQLVYCPTWGGNELIEIADGRVPDSKFLTFSSVMSKYAHRRLVIYVAAAIWFFCGTLLFVLQLSATANP